MKKVLLNSRLLINFLEGKTGAFSEGFGCFWKILNEDPNYQGYIKTSEIKRLSSSIEKIYDGDSALAESIVDDFRTVLNSCSSEDEISFDYVVIEDAISADSTSRTVSITQFLTSHELEKIYDAPYEEGISEPLFSSETDSSTIDSKTISGRGSDLLDSHDIGNSYLFDNSDVDFITGIDQDGIISGRGSDLLDSHDIGNSYLFGNSDVDFITGIDQDDTISGRGSDLLDSHDIGNSYLFGNSDVDFITGIDQNNDFDDLFGSNQ